MVVAGGMDGPDDGRIRLTSWRVACACVYIVIWRAMGMLYEAANRICPEPFFMPGGSSLVLLNGRSTGPSRMPTKHRDLFEFE